MRKSTIFQILYIFIFLIIASNPLKADDIDNQKKALDIIAEFSEKICSSIHYNGSRSNIKVTAEANAEAELKIMLKKIANLGIGGAVNYQEDEYFGILQKDLLKHISQNIKCKLEIFNALKDKLIPENEEKKRRSEKMQRYLFYCFSFLVFLSAFA